MSLLRTQPGHAGHKFFPVHGEDRDALLAIAYCALGDPTDGNPTHEDTLEWMKDHLSKLPKAVFNNADLWMAGSALDVNHEECDAAIKALFAKDVKESWLNISQCFIELATYNDWRKFMLMFGRIVEHILPNECDQIGDDGRVLIPAEGKANAVCLNEDIN